VITQYHLIPNSFFTLSTHPPPLFHWEGGLKLSKADLAVDFRRRQPRAFISHAHSDHIARHEYSLATPETIALYHLRLGPRPALPMPYRLPIEWGGLRLTTFPAGHCLGSAMLRAEDGGRSLLYTGDFKLDASATAERAELVPADVLVIESTYGTPAYRLPPRESAIEQLLTLIRQTLDEGAVPVIQAYALGKSQEVTKILTAAGIPVLQHHKIYEVSRVYQRCGVDLGRIELFRGQIEEGWALIVPPGTGDIQVEKGDRRAFCDGKGDSPHLPERPEGGHRRTALVGAQMGTVPFSGRQVHFAVTGWAVDPRTKYRWGVDHAIPLSDHADYDQLLRAIEIVHPKVVYCTHGPESFVERVRDRGFEAHPLGRPSQRRLF
jgi:putative mRNA 3-end processing factor